MRNLLAVVVLGLSAIGPAGAFDGRDTVLAQSKPTSARARGYALPKVVVGDILARTAGTYKVPVTLAEPATHTVYWPYATINRTAHEAWHYERGAGVVVFHPGETVKHITVKVLRPLASGEYFGVYLTGYPGHPAEYLGAPFAKGEGRVGNNSAFPATSPAETRIPIAFTRPTALAFEETFDPGFVANDSGMLPDGRLTWVTRPGHGRTQPGNQEIGYYADPELHPGTEPYGHDADGFFVQAEYAPEGLTDPETGEPLTYDYGAGLRPFTYTAGMITTELNFPSIRHGDYVEVRARLPSAEGSWPAIWLLPKEWWTWPAAEIDLMEGFFGAGYAFEQVATTTHWKTENGGHGSYGINAGIIRAALPSYDPLAFHTYGCHIGNERVTFTIDGIPYMQVPNMFARKDLYLLLNVAIQGQAPAPEQFPAKMHIEFARVYKQRGGN